MSDTAQLETAADPNAQLADAANAFKSFLNPPDPQPRGEDGKFASTKAEEPVEEEDEPEFAQEGDVEESEDEQVDDDEAADEAQPEAIDMPSSWSKEDAEAWAALPPETQAKIAEREGQRDAAVNLKFQEAANIRKANEAIVNEATANRDRYATAIDEVLSLVQLEEPNPNLFFDQDGNFDNAAWVLAEHQFKQASKVIADLKEQRKDLSAQQDKDRSEAVMARVNEMNRLAAPEFVKEVPELNDPDKAPKIMDEVVRYAISQGIPESTFSDPEEAKTVTLAELRIAWKAKEYDRIKEAEKRVKAGNPPPKPAQPAIKPGGVATRQSVQKSRLNKAQDRLAREGSVEAGAAVFKHLFKGI